LDCDALTRLLRPAAPASPARTAGQENRMMSPYCRSRLIIRLSWPADRPKADAGRSVPC